MRTNLHQFSAQELANYVVCPRAWHMKRTKLYQSVSTDVDRVEEGKKLRSEWAERQELSVRLNRYAKAIYLLLLVLVTVLLMFEARNTSIRLKQNQQTQSSLEQPGQIPSDTITESEQSESSGDRAAKIPQEIWLLLLMLGAIIIVWDLIQRRTEVVESKTGLKNDTAVAIKGSNSKPSRTFSSVNLGLNSQPDALLQERETLIPVDRYPMSKRIRDRHVVRLICHLALIEEETGNKPDYGILIMGKEARSVKIRFTEEKLKWLVDLIAEMREILGGKNSEAKPSRFKCQNCDFRDSCEASYFRDTES